MKPVLSCKLHNGYRGVLRNLSVCTSSCEQLKPKVCHLYEKTPCSVRCNAVPSLRAALFEAGAETLVRPSVRVCTDPIRGL